MSGKASCLLCSYQATAVLGKGSYHRLLNPLRSPKDNEIFLKQWTNWTTEGVTVNTTWCDLLYVIKYRRKIVIPGL